MRETFLLNFNSYMNDIHIRIQGGVTGYSQQPLIKLEIIEYKWLNTTHKIDREDIHYV